MTVLFGWGRMTLTHCVILIFSSGNGQASVEREPASNHPRCIPKLRGVACPAPYTNIRQKEIKVATKGNHVNAPTTIVCSGNEKGGNDNRKRLYRIGGSGSSHDRTFNGESPSFHTVDRAHSAATEGMTLEACKVYCCTY